MLPLPAAFERVGFRRSGCRVVVDRDIITEEFTAELTHVEVSYARGAASVVS